LLHAAESASSKQVTLDRRALAKEGLVGGASEEFWCQTHPPALSLDWLEELVAHLLALRERERERKREKEKERERERERERESARARERESERESERERARERELN